MTNNVEKRFTSHQNGENLATKGAEWDMAAAFGPLSRSDAAVVERWLKSGDTTKKRKQFIADCTGTSEFNPELIASYVRRARHWDTIRAIRARL
jgi:predicted GIY-YIG superfamily endonuclease